MSLITRFGPKAWPCASVEDELGEPSDSELTHYPTLLLSPVYLKKDSKRQRIQIPVMSL